MEFIGALMALSFWFFGMLFFFLADRKLQQIVVELRKLNERGR